MVPAERGTRARVPETVAGAAWRAGPSQDMGVAMLRVCLPPKSRCVGGWLSVTKISPSGHDEESRVCSQARVPNSSVSLVSGPGSALCSVFLRLLGFFLALQRPPRAPRCPFSSLSCLPFILTGHQTDACCPLLVLASWVLPPSDVCPLSRPQRDVLPPSIHGSASHGHHPSVHHVVKFYKALLQLFLY